jgi:hypothetical protein
MVGGPTCKERKPEGLFDKSSSVDRYVVEFDPRPVESGSLAPEPSVGHVRVRLGGGARTGVGGTWRHATAGVAGVGRT